MNKQEYRKHIESVVSCNGSYEGNQCTLLETRYIKGSVSYHIIIKNAPREDFVHWHFRFDELEEAIVKFIELEPLDEEGDVPCDCKEEAECEQITCQCNGKCCKVTPDETN